MNKILKYVASLAVLALVGCNDYIDVMPKGKRIPTTLEDYAVLLNYEYNVHYSPMLYGLYLLNSYQVNKSYFTTDDLRRANYLWDESADRITLNKSDEGTYYYNYAAINVANLVVEYAPDATECTAAEIAEVVATAKAIRAQCYYILVNFYADQYDKSTASSTLGVPVITSADVDAPYTQKSVQEVYDFILEDLNSALSNLPEVADNILLPNKATAYAMLARTYMSMCEYEKALENANKALAYNDALFDWNEFYDSYASMIEDPTSYTTISNPMTYTYVENYNFRGGDNAVNYATTTYNIPLYRAAKFEDGDAKFMTRWKYREYGENIYYNGITYGYHNSMGLTTVEMYLDKAECLARSGQIDQAMDVLNQVRVTRIRPDKYAPATASNLAEAIAKIRVTKDSEMIFSIVEFADARRFNHEGTYATTWTKEHEGVTYTLKPDSHLWTMVFPMGAVDNPGNGSISQNSK